MSHKEKTMTDKERLQGLSEDAKKQKKQRWEGIKNRILKDFDLLGENDESK